MDLSLPVMVLKTQIYTLTSVPVERQKILGVKGGLLKDDADLTLLGLKPNQKLTLMGSADAVPTGPSNNSVVFLEDLPESEQVAATLGLKAYTPGLVNLGTQLSLKTYIF